MTDSPAYTAVAPWFGSNRTLAANVGRALAGCRWVGIPFGGGMCEVTHIRASTILVSDLHPHVLNLAAVIADADLLPRLCERLDGLPFHYAVLEAAQRRCVERVRPGREVGGPDLDWAADYFVCAWMARNGTAGTAGEFNAGLSVRWDDGGGDSAVRFRNAAAGLGDWQRAMRRCAFVRLDVFDFLDRVGDRDGHALYIDPPFPDAGTRYKFAFAESDHVRLADRLAMFRACRVVCRFYDHPLVRDLYPGPAWTWRRYEGRRQTNDAGPEVLIGNAAALPHLPE